ncbi:NAAT family transporter [Pseudomonas sp. B21-040]|jgi:multiple antibiotic resistance protein|uniref:MarC family protein n=1 Tax=Pseudomonas TaxID=286 RepID=UPI0005FB82EF|nr:MULTISPECIES: MarC family protein [Pseudomonas]KJZ37003.1 antibiotic resistance protein MarC [Pseudomonas fluorescens]OOG14891.1 antibiotic resistance protein MarC [Pseudomonas sp. C9]PWK39691.1 multiple antibiotic resistance protein [Pseudomonas sp. OV226]UVL38394.1 NAAT family transporter [Pseudomonas sp. B21-040]
MNSYLTLFFGMFTTLLAIINPLEAIPVFLGLLHDKDAAELRRVARKACLYALLLMFFFLIFGNLLLRLFEVPLSMIRVVGGLILMKIGFELFAPSPNSSLIPSSVKGDQDIAFIPMAMPIMFGPGAIATVIGLTSTIKDSNRAVMSFAVVALAICATMFTTYLSLVYAKGILKKIGPQGIDAATRIVGFFVSAMGVGLIFHGTVEFLQSYGVLLNAVAK